MLDSVQDIHGRSALVSNQKLHVDHVISYTCSTVHQIK
jgi:hypothetical protein